MNWLKNNKGSILAWAFDFDENLLFCENTIWKISGIPIRDYPEFHCVWPHSTRWFDGLFLDVENALAKWNFGPSFETFKFEYLIKWRIWSIITARANSPDNFQRVMLYLNDVVLSKSEKRQQVQAIRENFSIHANISDREVLHFYFWGFMADYICCGNPFVQRNLWLDPENHVQRKVQALDWWIWEVERKIWEIWEKIGHDVRDVITPESPLYITFSDDDPKNTHATWTFLERKIQNSWERYTGRVFYTGE